MHADWTGKLEWEHKHLAAFSCGKLPLSIGIRVLNKNTELKQVEEESVWVLKW